MGAKNVESDVWMAELLAGAPGLRDALLRRLHQAKSAGDAAAAGHSGLLLLLHTLADFADFRGLPAALAAFDAASPDSVPAAAVRLGRPLLDHRCPFDDPALAPARERVVQALRAGSGLDSDERVLLAKVLLDFDGMVGNDMAPLERLLALMQETLPLASPRWQAALWRLRAQCLEYMGQTVAAEAATRELQAIAARLADPELAVGLAAQEMRMALHTDDRARAERAFRSIEQHRPHLRPALLPHGLRAQVALLLRRGDFQAALDRTRLILALCEEHEVPQRDRAGYVEQEAHALAGLGRHAEAVGLLESLRPTQAGGQAGVLEAIIAMARAVQGLAEGAPDAHERALKAVRRAAAESFHRFLMSFPEAAGQVAAIGLEAGVEAEFLRHAIRERRLPPPDPAPAAWPWPLRVRVLGGLRVWRDGVPLGGAGGKGQKKPLELMALLAAHPAGLDAESLIDALWPSLEADAPRASLEMTISRLRKWLDCAPAVRVADGRVSLDTTLAWTDVQSFDAAVRRDDADAALAAYTGPLLEGERVAGLLARARERLALQLVACTLKRAAALRSGGAQAEALALLTRALAAVPEAAALREAFRG
jgi:tetratricopeptide (TPR) repeat protein